MKKIVSLILSVFLILGAFSGCGSEPVETTAPAVPTNADRVLGEVARVTERIDNENSVGAVYVDGKTWTARSIDGTVIPAGDRVCIESMEGVKLFVKQVEKKTEVM